MNISTRTRAFVIAAASVSLIAVPLAMPASSAVNPPGACKKLTTKTVGTKLAATLSQCTPVAATGGTGGGTFTTSGTTGTLNITIKWAPGKGTTKANIKFAPAKGLGKCVKGSTSRVSIKGKVTGGTGTAFKTIKTGQAVSGSVCLGPKSYSLEVGTTLKF